MCLHEVGCCTQYITNRHLIWKAFLTTPYFEHFIRRIEFCTVQIQDIEHLWNGLLCMASSVFAACREDAAFRQKRQGKFRSGIPRL